MQMQVVSPLGSQAQSGRLSNCRSFHKCRTITARREAPDAQKPNASRCGAAQKKREKKKRERVSLRRKSSRRTQLGELLGRAYQTIPVFLDVFRRSTYLRHNDCRILGGYHLDGVPGTDQELVGVAFLARYVDTHFATDATLQVDFAPLLRPFDDSPIDGMEINISCPNVKEGGVSFGNFPESSAQVIAACRAATAKPIIAKLSPNQTDIRENARRCIEAGADALAVINTITGMAIDVEKREPIIANVQGGLSGPAIKPIALLKVKEVYEVAGPLGIPIIGQGGISTARDALEFIIAGASTVGIGTALFYEPLLCEQINTGIVEYLDRHGLTNVTELTGSLQLAPPQIAACG